MTTKTLNARETMRLLRVSRETLAALLESGKLAGFVRGKVIRVSRRSIEQLLGEDAAEQSPGPVAKSETVPT